METQNFTFIHPYNNDVTTFKLNNSTIDFIKFLKNIIDENGYVSTDILIAPDKLIIGIQDLHLENDEIKYHGRFRIAIEEIETQNVSVKFD